jgi:hypothetical protein
MFKEKRAAKEFSLQPSDIFRNGLFTSLVYVKYLLQHNTRSCHADARKHLLPILLLRNGILRASG